MKKVLIIDDEILNFSELELILEKNAITAHYCSSSSEAVDMAVQLKPDCILLDILMPDINGYEVASQIKSISNIKDIPIIFISSLTKIEDKKLAFSSGGTDYIPKPFIDEEVILRINTHIELREKNTQLKNEINFKNMLIESMPMGIAIIQDNILLPLNQSFYIAIGQSDSDEVIYIENILNEENRLSFYRCIENLKSANEVINIDLTIKKLNGEVNINSISLVNTFFDNEKVVIMIINEIDDKSKLARFGSDVVVNILNSLKTYADKYINALSDPTLPNLIDNKRISLNTTETRIIDLISSGLSNKEIAQKLDLSDIYIRKKISEIYKKANISNRVELINFFRR